MGAPPADQPYTWTDPATGTVYYLQAGRYYDVYGRPWQAAPDPAPYAAPGADRAGESSPGPPGPWPGADAGARAGDVGDPYRNWLSGDSGSRPWRYITDTDKTFYEDNPSQLYQQYLTDEFGGRQTPLAQYAGNQYGRYYADYLKWSEGDKSGQRTFGDTLTNNLAQQIRNSFSLQSPGQKGYTLMYQPGGRVTGF